MKIAVCGTQCIGKTTFINDFIEEWPMYTIAPKSYRAAITDQGLAHSTNGTEESQRAILNYLLDDQQNARGDHLLFDRCVFDNLIYTMWLSANGKVSDEFVKETITLVREALTVFDIIFFLPITKQSPVIIEPNRVRDIDPNYRYEIDILYKALMGAYTQHSKVYFPFDHDLGSPALIEIFGNRKERVELAKFYVNDKGNCFGDEDTLLDVNAMDEDSLALAAEVFSAKGIDMNSLKDPKKMKEFKI